MTRSPFTAATAAVTLRLSNPYPVHSSLQIGDGEATGTIENSEVSGLPPLIASFEDVPAEHDGRVFTFRVIEQLLELFGPSGVGG